MNVSLTPTEIRVLGALIEKELATPDYYPLSLSALTNACNQKTSRDPVMSLRETEVREALDSLVSKGLARERSPAGSRVSKFSHRLDDALGLTYGLSRDERCVLCVLMLRGPQTAGELRARGERLRGPHGNANVEAVLAQLGSRDRGPWVRELAREPGRREARWMHLLGGEAAARAPEPDPPPAAAQAPAGTISPADPAGGGDRVVRLEREVAALREELTALRARVDAISPDEPGQAC